METNDSTVDTGVVTGDQTTVDSGNNTPTPIELKDDSWVKIPGSDKPVKYGDYYRGLQGQLTRASQGRSALEKEVERLRQTAQSTQENTGKPVTPNKRQQMINQLRQKTYLSGEEAAGVVDNILGDFEQDLGTRDQAIQLLAKKIVQMDGQLGNLRGESTTSKFSNTIKNGLKANGLPDDLSDFAEVIYLAHEGEGLENEFPALLKDHWEKYAQLVRKMDQEKVTNARRSRLPGKGGQGSASKPMDFAGKSAKEQADAVWDMVQGSKDNT